MSVMLRRRGILTDLGLTVAYSGPTYRTGGIFNKGAGGTTLTIPWATLAAGGAVSGDLAVITVSASFAVTSITGMASINTVIQRNTNRQIILTGILTGSSIALINGSSQTTAINSIIAVYANAVLTGTPYTRDQISTNDLTLVGRTIVGPQALAVAAVSKGNLITAATTLSTTRNRETGRSIDDQQFIAGGATGTLLYSGTTNTSHVGAILELVSP